MKIKIDDFFNNFMFWKDARLSKDTESRVYSVNFCISNYSKTSAGEDRLIRSNKSVVSISLIFEFGHTFALP